MSTSARGATSRPTVRATHHRSLEDDTTEAVKRVTAIVLRVPSKSRTDRRALSRTLCRRCALDGPLGTRVTCSGDQKLRGFPITEKSRPEVMLAPKAATT